jgi:hypothetical protein
LTSSSAYSFALTNANIIESAYARIGVRRPEILAEKIQDGYRELNLALVKFSNLQPNLWTSEQQTVALVAGTATYTLPARSVMILSCFIRTGSGTSQNDRLIFPISEYEYASYPNKQDTGFPSVFWFNRQITPTLTFWLVPDTTQTYTAYLQVVRQVQDANLPLGETPDLPYRWLDAITSELAYRLARIYAPDKEQMRKADATEAWAVAATQDTENVGMTLQPGIGDYYR